ncbi:MAG TPA: DUF3892 domain-containing protein [Nitrososphaeraceae archaeon]|jgi:hypothetical protein|nr:DUF3892 domain-containing protein [Nitrososphaeraceae archaeon]
MVESQIVCIVRDENGAITAVGLDDGKIYLIRTVINLMREDRSFFAKKYGFKTPVYAKQHHRLKERWFLTTDLNSRIENTLDFLPPCTSH